MTAIEIGSAAVNDTYNTGPEYTKLETTGPATGTGKITQIQTYTYQEISGAIVGTFYGSGFNWTSRDSEFIGTIGTGLKTFSDLDIAVKTGDIIGLYWSSGNLDITPSSADDYLKKYGNQFGAGQQTYEGSAYTLSLYGSGVTSNQINKISEIEIGDISKINTASITDLAKINGIEV